MEIRDIVDNVNVWGIEESIRGAKFPMSVDTQKATSSLTDGIRALAMSPKGEGHDTWLQGCLVQFDLTFTVKAWTEAERYHFLDFVSSQSTMHRITRFDLDKAYIEYVDSRMIQIMKEKVVEYNEIQKSLNEEDPGSGNAYDLYKKSKEKYLEILYSNPCGMKLTARMVTNYRQLKTIYSQRKNHKLPEWQLFCKWLETLPHAEFICGAKNEIL